MTEVRLLVAAAVCGLAWSAGASAADVPAIQLLSGTPVTPANAWSYFGSGTAHTNGVAYSPTRAPEIRALARSLSRDGDVTGDALAERVFDYVQKNIDIEFQFGLGKGARGAVIDQSGTAFDQAQLMVEVLREAGATASYQLGTITLDAGQFGRWTGLVTGLNEGAQTFTVNARAACELLAGGGIPATVNGSSGACTSLSGNLSTVTLGHVWVLANGKAYDPAFKRHVLRAGIDLPAAMGCGTAASPTCGSQLDTAVGTGASSGTQSGASYLQNLNQGAVETKVQTFATALQTAIEAIDPVAPLEAIVGGATPDLTFATTFGAALPYQAGTQTTWSGDVPDQYRTTFRVQFLGLDATLYADEISGQRVRLSTIGPTTTWTRTSRLWVEDQQVAIGSALAGPSWLDQPALSVNHPFAANSGAYGDETATLAASTDVRTSGFCWSSGGGTVCPLAYATYFDLMLELGSANPYRAQHAGRMMPHYPIGTEANGWFSVTKPVATTLAAQYVVQTTAATRIVGALSKTAPTSIHTLGALFHQERNGDGQVKFNLRSAFAVTSATASSTDRAAAFAAITASASALEGSVSQQSDDSYVGMSSVSVFKLMNDKGYRFYSATSSNIAGVLNGTTNYSTARKSLLQGYANLGYTVILSQNGNLGSITLPAGGGMSAGAAAELVYTSAAQGYLTNELYKGGGAIGGNEPVEAATRTIEEASPSYKSEEYWGIDVASGNLNLTPPADLSVGTASAPGVELRRFYSSADNGLATGTIYLTGEYPVPVPTYDIPTPLAVGGGWSSNVNVTANWAGNGLEGLGDTSAVRASRAIAALYGVYDLNKSQTFRKRMATIFTAYSLSTGFVLNSIAVQQPPASHLFVRLPNGRFDPPPTQRDMTLTVTGAPTQHLVATGPCLGFVMRNFDGTQLTLTAGDGSSTTFALWEARWPWCISGPLYDRGSYAATRTTAADGSRLTYSYSAFVEGSSAGPPSGYTAKALQDVSSSTGAHIAITDQVALTGAAEISDGQGRSAEWSCTSVPGLQVGWTQWSLDAGFFLKPCGGGVAATNALGGVSSTVFAAAADFGSVFPSTVPVEIYTPSSSTMPFLQVDYDPILHVSTVTDNTGRTQTAFTAVAADERYRIGELRDGEGGRVSTVFDLRGQPIEETDPLGRVTSYVHDDAGRLLRTVYPEGDATELSYDRRGNVLTECAIAKGRVNWSALTPLTERTPQCNAGLGDLVTTTVYVGGPTLRADQCPNMKTCNRPTHVIDPAGNRANYTWNSTHGQLETITAGLNSAGTCALAGGVCPLTTYTYSSFIGVDSATFYLVTSKTERISASTNTTTTYSYYGSSKYFGLQTGAVDSGGLNLVGSYDYDPMGNVTSINGPRTDVVDVTSYAWDALRRLVIVSPPDPDGAGPAMQPRTITRYDADGLANFTASLQDDGDWLTTVTEHDAAGRPTRVARPKPLSLGAGVDTVAEVEALALQAIGGGGQISVTVYDAAGRAIYSADPTGRATYTEYFADNSVYRVSDGYLYTASGAVDAADFGATAAARNYRTNAYSLNGLVVSVTNARGHATSFTYDGFDRPLRTTYPDTSYEENQTYDAVGNIIQSRNRAGQVITFGYDVLSRLVTKSTPERTERFAYDMTHLRTCAAVLAAGAGPGSCSAGATRTDYLYDAAGRLASETSVRAGISRTVGYGYNAASSRTRIIWPDMWRADYAYDALERMTSVTFDSNGDGAADGALANHVWDRLGRLSSVARGGSAWGAGATSDLSLSYETDGDIDRMTHRFAASYGGAGQLFDYGYDAAARLVSDSAPVDWRWSPPATGTVSYAAATVVDQYPLVGGQALSHDANGNRTSYNGLITTHDSENRLATASRPGMSVTYLYDAAGRRVAKDFTQGGADVDVLWADEMEIAEYDGQTLLRRYVPGIKVDDRISMILANGTISHYHSDRLGNVSALTTATGAVLDRYVYTPYGVEVSTDGDPSGQPFRYTGRYADAETGLLHYRARYYDPEQGRFLETDPIRYGDGMNLYAYVGNDPINGWDPTGTCEIVDGEIKNCDVDDTYEGLTADQIQNVEDVIIPAIVDVGLYIQENGTQEMKDAWAGVDSIDFSNTTMPGSPNTAASNAVSFFDRVNPLTGETSAGDLRTSDITYYQPALDSSDADWHAEIVVHEVIHGTPRNANARIPFPPLNPQEADAVLRSDSFLRNSTGLVTPGYRARGYGLIPR